jgi:hypothetical protein
MPMVWGRYSISVFITCMTSTNPICYFLPNLPILNRVMCVELVHCKIIRGILVDSFANKHIPVLLLEMNLIASNQG